MIGIRVYATALNPSIREMNNSLLFLDQHPAAAICHMCATIDNRFNGATEAQGGVSLSTLLRRVTLLCLSRLFFGICVIKNHTRP